MLAHLVQSVPSIGKVVHRTLKFLIDTFRKHIRSLKNLRIEHEQQRVIEKVRIDCGTCCCATAKKLNNADVINEQRLVTRVSRVYREWKSGS